MTVVYGAFALRIHDRPDKLLFSPFYIFLLCVSWYYLSLSVTGAY